MWVRSRGLLTVLLVIKSERRHNRRVRLLAKSSTGSVSLSLLKVFLSACTPTEFVGLIDFLRWMSTDELY